MARVPARRAAADPRPIQDTVLGLLAALAGAVLARADSQINDTALLAAIWAAAQACFIRAGIANEAQKAQG